MKMKPLIWFGLCIQSLFLVFWVLRAPGIGGELKVAQNELQKGDPDLPTLVIRVAGSETTVAYDPSKSASENLLARTKARLTIAAGAYESIARIPLLVGLLNVVLLIVLLRWGHRGGSARVG